jgi:hypothetical protein
MAVETIDLSTDLTAGVYKSDGVAAANNYCVIPVTWASLNGQPEIVVETAVEDVEASYHPAKMIGEYGVDTPIKLRLWEETTSIDGEILTVDSVYGDTPFVRVVIYGGNCTEGTITFEINVG